LLLIAVIVVEQYCEKNAIWDFVLFSCIVFWHRVWFVS